MVDFHETQHKIITRYPKIKYNSQTRQIAREVWIFIITQWVTLNYPILDKTASKKKLLVSVEKFISAQTFFHKRRKQIIPPRLYYLPLNSVIEKTFQRNETIGSGTYLPNAFIFRIIMFVTQWDGLFIVGWVVSSVTKTIRGVSYLVKFNQNSDQHCEKVVNHLKRVTFFKSIDH